jgi:peroxiredoxin
MRESEMPLLHVGDPFPPLGLTQPGGEALALPGAFAGNFSVVLFYRGSWCRYCVEQLRAFQRASVRLAEAGIEVAALSVDDETTTAELIGKYGLTFAVGHSADAIALSAETGAFANLDPPYLQSTGFVLDSTGNVIISVYSCGAIGQLVPDDVLELVRDLDERPTNPWLGRHRLCGAAARSTSTDSPHIAARSSTHPNTRQRDR